MSKLLKSNTYSENLSNTQGLDESAISNILNRYIYHWPVFLVGLLFTFSMAFLYMRYSKPIYEIKSSLLIKDEKKGMPSADILSQLDLFGDSKVVENEIEILQSKKLMRQVVDRLHLDVKYVSDGRVISKDIYDNSPIIFTSIRINADSYGKEFELTVQNNEKYVLKDINSGEAFNGSFDKIVSNAIGTYKISKSSSFKNNNHFKIGIALNDPVLLTDSYLSSLTVSVAGKQSTVLDLTFQSTHPKRGRDILNTLIDVYNEASLLDKSQITQSTIKFIDERLGLITGELTSVEKEVESFKSDNGLTDIGGEASLYLENVKANDAQINEVNIKLSTIEDIRRFVISNSSNEKLPSTFGINDPTLLAQITQLGELKLEKDRLLATTQVDNPLVESLLKQIKTTRESIISNVQNIQSSLVNTKKELNENNSKFQSSIRRIPTQERQFISIKRQQSIKETLYLYLLQKKEEAALSYASTVADSRVIDEAISSTFPIKPKGALTYLAAFIFGLIIPVSYLYAKDLVNTRVSQISNISELTNAPLLGDVIHNDSDETIVVKPNNRTAIAEQFRAIRTNMQFLTAGNDTGIGNVTLLTSSMSGEGKSFIASNLAAALALSGRKTVLLELDLRKPKISKYLNLANGKGISNYLIGNASLQEIIRPSSINENLFIIGSGPIPPNPSELLLQKSAEKMISDLRLSFDEVLIDSPPIGLVTDAQILAKMADSTIYVVRHKVTFKSQLANLEKLYVSGNFPKINVIFNGVKQDGNTGAYGYGYGYYTDDSKRKINSFASILREFFKRF